MMTTYQRLELERKAAHVEKMKELAVQFLKPVRDTLPKAQLHGHRFDKGRLVLTFVVDGRPVHNVGFTTAQQAPKLIGELFFSLSAVMDTQAVNWSDREDVASAIVKLRDPVVAREVKRLRDDVVALGERLEADRLEAKREEMRKEFRQLVKNGKARFGLDRDEVVDLLEQEIKLIRVEDVQVG